MADEAGGNEGDKQESSKDVLESPEVKAALERAREEARNEGYRKGQSDTDKATQAALDKAKTAEEKLAALEKAQFENLSEEERQKKMIERIYENLQNGNESKVQQDAPATTSKDEPKADPNSKLKEVAKSEGLDPDKLDFTSTESFLKSWNEQVKGGKKDPDESNSDEDESGGKSKSGGAVDSGGGNPAKTDITKVQPTDIFRKAHAKNHGGS